MVVHQCTKISATTSFLQLPAVLPLLPPRAIARWCIDYTLHDNVTSCFAFSLPRKFSSRAKSDLSLRRRFRFSVFSLPLALSSLLFSRRTVYGRIFKKTLRLCFRMYTYISRIQDAIMAPAECLANLSVYENELRKSMTGFPSEMVSSSMRNLYVVLLYTYTFRARFTILTEEGWSCTFCHEYWFFFNYLTHLKGYWTEGMNRY